VNSFARFGRSEERMAKAKDDVKEAKGAKAGKDQDVEKNRRNEAVKRAVDLIEKQFGNGAILKLSDTAKKIPAARWRWTWRWALAVFRAAA
jgi:hypothetical protein